MVELPATTPLQQRETAQPGVDPAALWRVMGRQVALYTGMESSSVPEETAQELLASVLFCLRTAQRENPEAQHLPLEEWLLLGQRILTARHRAGQRLQQQARGLLAPLDNAVYRGALRETDRFFTWYDIRFLAHQIPGMLDYPLALPVDDALLGVDYINAWLHRRIWEDSFCRLFRPEAWRAVLLRFNSDYTELPLNLFEPVLYCALGKSLLHRDNITLAPEAQAPAALQKLFGRCGLPEATRLLAEAAARLCNRLHIWESARRSYIADCARALAPHVLAADTDGLGNLFVC